MGVREDYLRAQLVSQVALLDAFHGSLRAHGHEYGRFDGPMRRVQDSGARPGYRALRLDLESHNPTVAHGPKAA